MKCTMFAKEAILVRNAFLAAVLLVIAGCGEPRSMVHGTVTFQGAPLKHGTIIFLGPDERTYPVPIQADGSYAAVSLPRGKILVALHVDEPRAAASRTDPDPDPDDFGNTKAREEDRHKGRKQRPAPVADERPTLPSHYLDPNQSGLSFQLDRPSQEYSLDLK
jgi:hypothetical protein